MNRLTELAAKLTPAQLKEVEDFAEFLAVHDGSARKAASKKEPLRLANIDALVGLCSGMGGDRTNKELIRQSWDDVVKKATSY